MSGGINIELLQSAELVVVVDSVDVELELELLTGAGIVAVTTAERQFFFRSL